ALTDRASLSSTLPVTNTATTSSSTSSRMPTPSTGILLPLISGSTWSRCVVPSSGPGSECSAPTLPAPPGLDPPWGPPWEEAACFPDPATAALVTARVGRARATGDTLPCSCQQSLRHPTRQGLDKNHMTCYSG